LLSLSQINKSLKKLKYFMKFATHDLVSTWIVCGSACKSVLASF